MDPTLTVIIGLAILAGLFCIGFWVVVVQRDHANRELVKAKARAERAENEAHGSYGLKSKLEAVEAENALLRKRIDQKAAKWTETRAKYEEEVAEVKKSRANAWKERDALVEKLGAAIRLLRDGPAKGGPVSVVNVLRPEEFPRIPRR